MHRQQQQQHPQPKIQQRRGILYIKILLILIIQAIVLPWLVMEKGEDDGNYYIGSQNAGNPPPSLVLRNNNKGKRGEPDGAFNSYPIYLKKEHDQSKLHSNVHCIGDTHDPQTAWMYRSCEFQNLCLNVTSKEFVFIESTTLHKFNSRRIDGGGIFSSTTAAAGGIGNYNIAINSTTNSTDSSKSSSNYETNMAMALGGINPRWNGNDFNQGIHKVKWFPTQILQEEDSAAQDYYELDPNVVMLPFHSFAAHNVGHLLWDDFLPIYTLLEIFDFVDKLQNKQMSLLLLRVDTLPLLYGTCEMRRNKLQKCTKNLYKFLPLLGITNPEEQFTTLKSIKFHHQEQGSSSSSSSSLICAKTAIAGLGMLTDHGYNDHGWYPETDMKRGKVHNTAKGQLLWKFRKFMLTNIGLPIGPSTQTQQRKFQILLSQHSSGDGPRDVSMSKQYHILQRTLPTTASIQVVNLATIPTLEEQLLLVSQTNIFVSTTGGGSMTATFLPKGATLILFYQKTGGFDFHNFNFTGNPSYLDYDLFNNMSYIRVHWLPIETMETKEGLDTLVSLIQYEMEAYYDK